ncbi:MAG TPA: DUF2283 domain-containing protein [Desulfotomaculum sp.]|nr:DUF2283 domain-containing protein [Desulfotomaculum sp.]
MKRIRYSKDVDALLIELSDKTIDYAEDTGQIIVHFSKDGEPVLIEILDAKDFLLRSFSTVVTEQEAALP